MLLNLSVEYELRAREIGTNFNGSSYGVVNYGSMVLKHTGQNYDKVSQNGVLGLFITAVFPVSPNHLASSILSGINPLLPLLL